MKQINRKFLTRERALFQGKGLEIHDTTFADRESPLKESGNTELYHSIFKQKYPLWYSHSIKIEGYVLFEMGHAGIRYTGNISMESCVVEAPKNLRRATEIELGRVTMPNAGETLRNCYQIQMDQVSTKGDYFAMNSNNLYIDGFELVGNYPFSEVKNVEIHHARLLPKNTFWNSESVTVYNSFISGEYLDWNTKNLTLINCTTEDSQGMYYINNLMMENCHLLNTTLTFEYSMVDVEMDNTVDSVLSPNSGIIRAEKIEELIMDASEIDATEAFIQTKELKGAV